MLVSVIIPSLNEKANIQRCVRAARRNYSHDEVEIIVVDGGSVDGTPDLIPEDEIVLHTRRGRALQLNAGAAKATGGIFVFCHSDTFLPEGWREPVIAALQKPNVSGGVFQTAFDDPKGIHKWHNRWKRPAYWAGMQGDQVQFMRRDTFEAVGGYPDKVLMEDLDMARALNQAGDYIRLPEEYRVVTSSRRFNERGILRQSVEDWWFSARYLYLGATAEDIARRYQSSREAKLKAMAEAVQAMQRRLILYAKRPIAGYSKTRLGMGLGDQAAAGVYARLLYSTLSEARDCAKNGCHVQLSVANEDDVDWFRHAWPEFEVRTQIEGDLGTRMHHSLQSAFDAGMDAAVLAGSDIPGLNAGLFRLAFEMLVHADVVLGPAVDGGYYLIGMRAPGADVFRDIPWSTSDVFDATREQALAQGLVIAYLPTLSDLDTIDEYEVWQADVGACKA